MEEKRTPQYRPRGANKELLILIEKHWDLAYQQRTRSYRHLSASSLERFWQRSRDHYNGIEPRTSGGNDSHGNDHFGDTVEAQWKSRAFKKKTRHKVIATIAQFIRSGMGVDFAAFDEKDRLDREMSKVIEDCYDWSAERERLEYKKVGAYMEMVISGTVHWLDEIAWDTRDVKEIMDIDFETGEVTWEKKTITEFKGCRSEIVPNEEMYPGDVWTRDIQEQPFLIRRRITTMAQAEKALSRYPNWKYVRAGSDHFFDSSVESEADQARPEDSDDEVELVYYWNKSEDVYAIVANKVLLTKADNPFPYPHKQYPWAKDVFEPFADARFYWGDSLPNKNWDDQETINALWRMFIDSTKLKNKPPLFTNNIELANTDLVVPGTITAKGMGDTVEALDAISQGVTQSEFNVLAMAERQVDENSVDPLVAAQTPQGDPTATEVRAIVGAAEALRGFNEQFTGNLLVQHAALRIPNILWFLTHDDEYQKVVLGDVKTATGKNGKRQITFTHAANLPTPEQLLQAENRAEKAGEPTDFVYVDKDSVNDYRYHVSFSAVPKENKRTSGKSLLKAIQKYQLYVQNPIFDQRANANALAEAMGDDPEEMVAQPPPPTPMGGVPGQKVNMPSQPREMTQALAGGF